MKEKVVAGAKIAGLGIGGILLVGGMYIAERYARKKRDQVADWLVSEVEAGIFLLKNRKNGK